MLQGNPDLAEIARVASIAAIESIKTIIDLAEVADQKERGLVHLQAIANIMGVMFARIDEPERAIGVVAVEAAAICRAAAGRTERHNGAVH